MTTRSAPPHVPTRDRPFLCAGPFAHDEDVAAIGEGLLDHSLPKGRWTHAAHFAAVLWIIRERIDLSPVRHVPEAIQRYNVATGGVNSDDAGYHETITQASIRAARAFVRDAGNAPLHQICNALLATRLGDKDWPLDHWRRERLFSVAARRGWIEPDRTPLPF
jgi:hypothetical protein